MDERWVCKRCFTSNNGAFARCSNCGLERGAEVPAEETSAAAPPAERRGFSWSSLAGFWWVGLIVVVAVVGALFAAQRDEGGQIVEGGDLDVVELRVGDCFDLEDATATEVADVDAKPCDEPHEFEMYFIGDMPDGDFPSESGFLAFFEDECMPAFEEFVGVPYEESQLDIYWLTPTEEGWAAGDRQVQCSVFHPVDDELTGSLEGSGR